MSKSLITLYPSFYSQFTCKAGDCVHSCCVQDWEIDIDDDTAALYQSMDGPLGEEIRKAMRKNDETYYWDMKDGKCPFLNTQGLCRIVLEKGEGALCDICAMHPRFFVYAGDFELAGTGLCCEKTVELLLEEDGPLVLVTEYPEEKATLASLLHALGYTVDERSLIFIPSISAVYYEKLLSYYEKTEPINAAWTASLLHLKNHVKDAVDHVLLKLWDIPVSWLHRVYQYILYRGLEKAETYGLPAVMAYARESVDFILLSTTFYGDFPEQVRLWSEQIEYDTENVDRLMSQSEELCSFFPEVPARRIKQKRKKQDR